MEFFQNLINNDWFRVLVVVIVLDTILGILRSIKEKNTNSSIGIDGIIRKVAMMFCIVFLSLIDYTVHINLIGFIPEQAREVVKLGDVGIADLFNLLFIIFEFLSILKNAILCKLPIPKKLQTYLENIMKEFTSEIKDNVKVISTSEVHIENPEQVTVKKEGEE